MESLKHAFYIALIFRPLRAYEVLKRILMENRHKVKTVRLKPEVIDKIDKIAVSSNRTFSNTVETILLNYKPKENEIAL